MTQELREEFEQYLEDISAETEPLSLPEYLSDYEILACMQDSPQKKTFLLKVKSGRKILCKYACGEFQMMLRTEYEVSAMGSFAFLPYIIDYCETAEGSVLLREYIEGRTLRELVEEDGVLRPADALPIIRKVCQCLLRLHTAAPALIHRDIKPSNIVMTASGDCYLVDMGTVRHYQEGSGADTFCMGTTGFAAPEQFGARQTDVRTDIYGLGNLFFYLLTGNSNVQEASFDGLSRPVSAFIRKCTAFNPGDRYDDMHQVQKALDRLKEIRKPPFSLIVACASTFLALMLLTVMIVPKLNAGNKEVVFSSSLLEQAVKQELGKSDQEIVRQEDLKKIRCLEICGNTVLHSGDGHDAYVSLPHTADGIETGYGDISDLSLLAQMPNLSRLTLDSQRITDLSALKGLPLVSLSLCGNPVADISPLSGCNTLYELNLSYTKVMTLDPLADCSSLQVLYCISTPVRSLAPLSGSGLAELHLLDTVITDFSPLENVPLTFLECSHISPETLQDIRKISTLRGLCIFHSSFPTLEAFDGFSDLPELSVMYDTLQSLDGIENFPHLNTLSIAYNPISECRPIPTLLNLRVSSTGIRDFSFLNEMPGLAELTLSEAQRPCLEEAVPEPWFEVILEN